MIELRKWPKKMEVVTDDANAEAAILDDVLVDEPRLRDLSMRFAAETMQHGEIVVEVKPEEVKALSEVLASADYCGHVAAELAEIAKAD